MDYDDAKLAAEFIRLTEKIIDLREEYSRLVTNRHQILRILRDRGYNYAQIGRMTNLSASRISQMLAEKRSTRPIILP